MNSYKRIAPHLQRVLADGGAISDNVDDLRLLHNSNEQYKDYLKLAFCPELYGNKIRTSSNVNYITKSYSANNVNQELNINEWPYGTVSLIGNGSQSSQYNYLVIGNTYTVTTGIGNTNLHFNYGSGWSSITSGSFTFIATTVWCLFRNNSTTENFTFTPTLQRVLSNDLYQSVDTNQPYLDKIAPAEKLSAKNPNGGSKYLNHPVISFGITDSYTVELQLKLNYGDNVRCGICGGVQGTGIRYKNDGVPSVSLEIYSVSSMFNPTIVLPPEKTITLTIVYNSTLSKTHIYINGDLKYTADFQFSCNYEQLFASRKEAYYGHLNIYSYHLISKALSQQEVSERAGILRSIFPEIPSVRIGDQIWSVRNFEAVVTPQGNAIPEMQASGNVEKITDGEFTSSSNWSMDLNWIISNGVATASSGIYPQAVYQNGKLTTGKYYKCTIDIASISGGKLGIAQGGYSLGIFQNSGVSVVYFQALNSQIGIRVIEGTVNAVINSVSFQEVGWSDSQNLYDYIYANTSGTVEQKTYAGVKASAMWCHYNNDSALGAVYGKLYNWFSVKLLQMDIDYYNANNPTTPWGWRVPTQADFQALSTALGGNVVSGGKLKKEGLVYWNNPNVGATNESGFSLIGTGSRDNNGSFGSLGSHSYMRDINSNLCGLNNIDNNILYFQGWSNISGFSLRLIKT